MAYILLYCGQRMAKVGSRAINNYYYQKKAKSKVDIRSAKKFIKTWHNSTSTKEVAGKLKISKALVYSRAKFLKQKGIELPPMLPGRNSRLGPEDIEELKQLNQQLLKEKETGN